MNEKNELLEEIWLARREIEQKNNYDIEKIYKTYKTRQAKHPRKYHSGNPVKLKKLKAA